jgi:hypothetical protein
MFSGRSSHRKTHYPTFPNLGTEENPRDLSPGFSPCPKNDFDKLFIPSSLTPFVVESTLESVDYQDLNSETIPQCFFNQSFPELFFKMKKRLEENEFLHLWIDLIFGVHQNSIEHNTACHPSLYQNSSNENYNEITLNGLFNTFGTFSNPIFRSLHPQMKSIISPNTIDFIKSLNKTIITASCITTTDFIILDIDGYLHIYQISSDDEIKCSEKKSTHYLPECIFSVAEHELTLFDPNSATLFFNSINLSAVIHTTLTYVSKIQGNQSLFVILYNRSILKLYIDLNEYGTICSFDDEIIDFHCNNNKFSCFVFITRNGF